MKNIFWILIIGFFLSNEIEAQENSAQKAYNLGYAYGGHLGLSLEFLDLAIEEKDVDKFVEGFIAGLTIDSASFDAAQKRLEDRWKRAELSKTIEEAQAVAYDLGVNSIGGIAVEVGVLPTDFDLAALKEGFSEGVSGNVSKMKREEMDSILKDYFDPKAEEYRVKIEARQKTVAPKALEEGTKFLEQNKARKGVITTASGLQYEIIRNGEGANATIDNKVKVHYHGTLIDGSIFDSSVDRGVPATFPLNYVIKGWQEGLVLMNKGAKYRFFIPQELGYGMQSPSPAIPAGSVLIFEVELLEIITEKNTDLTLEQGTKFLEQNKTKKGVITTASGLQYEIIKKGKGPKVKSPNQIKAHYHGTLIDGTIFDSSVDRGEPITFPLDAVILGWQEGLALMNKGAKYRFFIPEQLGYGNRAMGKIPAGSVLIFEVELLEIISEKKIKEKKSKKLPK